MKQQPIVAVVGKGRNCPAAVYDAAREVGRAVARARAILITGGLGGVMEAAACGATDEGGLALGLIPRQFKGNRFCAIAIRTGLPEPIRNVVMGNAAQAMLALPGSHGTMQEALVALDRGIPVAAVILDATTPNPVGALPGIGRVGIHAVDGWLKEVLG